MLINNSYQRISLTDQKYLSCTFLNEPISIVTIMFYFFERQ